MHDETTLQRACITSLHLSRWYVGDDKIMAIILAAYCSCLKPPRKLYFHVCKVTEKPGSTPLRVCEEEKAASWGRALQGLLEERTPQEED